MAVQTKWASALVESNKKDNPALVSGGKLLCVASVLEVANSDSDGSVFYLAKLPSNAIPIKCEIAADSLTGGNNWDLGLYKEDGVVADADLFAATLDMSSGFAIGSETNGLKTGPAIANFGKKLWELLGLGINAKEEGYRLALTANTIGSVGGTISTRFWYILG